MYRKIALMLLAVVGLGCGAEPTTEEQVTVEAEFLQGLVDGRLVPKDFAPLVDGTQMVLESVENILLELFQQNGQLPEFSASLAHWRAFLLARLIELKLDFKCVEEVALEFSLVEVIKREYLTPLETIMRKKGFVCFFGSIDHFYRHLALVYPFEFETSECDVPYKILQRYVKTVEDYTAAAAGKGLGEPEGAVAHYDTATSGLKKMASVTTSCSAPGSSPGLRSCPSPFADVADVRLASVRPGSLRGVKGKRGAERTLHSPVASSAAASAAGGDV